ncbi:thioredoxin family protein [Mycoplasmopsis fermentans]|uniref:thioredoxin family protein n=1 Tax=Mycoplasmopsis fermentans TaxID=2115 RepID=UPI000F0422F8|nr:thioredoxin family protein [Mycoplasmopsis fermentans]RMX34935.1 thioredoxin family protein [Mycoplasmopsis fermentans MF-I1]RMX35008.1 thioredoxin family protein [Mycoplasmopsis fermentans MF-I2]
MKQVAWNEVQNMVANSNNENNIYFITFTTSWCPDCKVMKPVVESVEEEYKEYNEIIFLEVDAEKAQLFREINNRWKILHVPTFLIMKNNKIIQRGENYYPKEILCDWVEKVLE